MGAGRIPEGAEPSGSDLEEIELGEIEDAGATFSTATTPVSPGSPASLPVDQPPGGTATLTTDRITGKIRLRPTAEGVLRRYDPDGNGHVAAPGDPPVRVLTAQQAEDHPATDWEHGSPAAAIAEPLLAGGWAAGPSLLKGWAPAWLGKIDPGAVTGFLNQSALRSARQRPPDLESGPREPIESGPREPMPEHPPATSFLNWSALRSARQRPPDLESGPREPTPEDAPAAQAGASAAAVRPPRVPPAALTADRASTVRRFPAKPDLVWARLRVQSAIRVLSAAGVRLLPDSLGTDPGAGREAFSAALTQLGDQAQRASSVAELTDVEKALAGQFAGIETIRLALTRDGGADPLIMGRPEWYMKLTQRLTGLLPRLEALPPGPLPVPGARAAAGGTQPQVREQLMAATREFLRAYLIAAALQADSTPGGGNAATITVPDPRDGRDGRDPVQGAMAEQARRAVEELRGARDQFDDLLTQAEHLITAAGSASAGGAAAATEKRPQAAGALKDPEKARPSPERQPPTATALEKRLEASPPPRVLRGAGAAPEDLPAPETLSERFDPPYHLTDVSPVLGSLDTVTDISEAVISRIRQEALQTLPRSLQTAKTRALIAEKTTKEKLLRNAPELVSSRHTIEVCGYQIHVRLHLLNGRQISNVVTVRNKSMENQSSQRGRALNHGDFKDINHNLTYANDNVAGASPFQMSATEGYFGLFTVVTGEHNETIAELVQDVRENTIKSSTFAGYMYSYRTWVQVSADTPDGRTVVLDNDAAPLGDGIRIVSSRETLPPHWDPVAREIDQAAVQASEAVHASLHNKAVLWTSRAAAGGPQDAPVLLPGNSAIEAFNPAAEIRRLVHAYVLDAAPPGSYERRRLDAGLTMRAQKLQAAKASKGGSEIVFGGARGGPAQSVTWRLELFPEDVPILADNGTWMDLDDRQVRTHDVSEESEDAFDLPPGVGLLATEVNLLQSNWLTFWGYLWPSRDVQVSRSGAGMTTTSLTGIRYIGEPTSVTRMRAGLMLTRSDRPGDQPQRHELDSPVFTRTLRKDTGQWAILPPTDGAPDAAQKPAPQVRAPENIGANLGSLTRVSELTVAAGPGEPPKQINAYQRVESMLQADLPGYLPRRDGSERLAGGLASKQARANERQLKDALSDESIRGNIRQAATGEGHGIPIAKSNASGRLTQWAVIRVRARFGYFDEHGVWVPAQPDWSAWLHESELDANITVEQNTIVTRLAYDALWAGFQVTAGIGQAYEALPNVVLDGVELRPMYHQRVAKLIGATTGQAIWGMYGFSIDGLTEFTGPVTLFLSVETGARPLNQPDPTLPAGGAVRHFAGHGRPLRGLTHRPPLRPFDERDPGLTSWNRQNEDTVATTALARPSPGGLLRRRPGNHAEHGSSAGATAPPFDPVDSFAPPKWERYERRADPIPTRYKVIIPTGLTSKQITISDAGTTRQIWVPYDLDKTNSDGKPIGIGPERLIFQATDDNPFPFHLYVESTGDGVTRAVITAFSEMGYPQVDVHTRLQIETALQTAIADGAGLRAGNRYKKIWEGPIAGHSATGLVEIRQVVDRVETVATPTSYGSYTDFGSASVSGLIDEATGLSLRNWSYLANLRGRFPLKIGTPYPNNAPASNDDPPLNTPYTFTGQPQYLYRLEKTQGNASEQAASDARFNLEITALAVGPAQVRYHIQVKTWRTGDGSGDGTQQRNADVVNSGHAMLSARDATELGLMPPWLAVYPDKSITYHLPPDDVGTIRAETIARPPDLTAFIERLLDAVEQHFGTHARKAAASEVEKIQSPFVAAGLLPEMTQAGDRDLGGTDLGVPLEVTYTENYRVRMPFTKIGIPRTEWSAPHIPVNRTIRIDIAASLSDPDYKGVIPVEHHLDIRTSKEQSHEVNMSRTARHAIDFLRFWHYYTADDSSWFAALWHNLNLTHFGITTRKTGVASSQKDTKSKTLDIGSEGAAEFKRKVRFSATITRDSAPGVALDTASFGRFQRSKTISVPASDDTASTVITRHDTQLLDQAPQQVQEEIKPAPEKAQPVTEETRPAPEAALTGVLPGLLAGQTLPLGSEADDVEVPLAAEMIGGLADLLAAETSGPASLLTRAPGDLHWRRATGRVDGQTVRTGRPLASDPTSEAGPSEATPVDAEASPTQVRFTGEVLAALSSPAQPPSLPQRHTWPHGAELADGRKKGKQRQEAGGAQDLPLDAAPVQRRASWPSTLKPWKRPSKDKGKGKEPQRSSGAQNPQPARARYTHFSAETVRQLEAAQSKEEWQAIVAQATDAARDRVSQVFGPRTRARRAALLLARKAPLTHLAMSKLGLAWPGTAGRPALFPKTGLRDYAALAAHLEKASKPVALYLPYGYLTTPRNALAHFTERELAALAISQDKGMLRIFEAPAPGHEHPRRIFLRPAALPSRTRGSSRAQPPPDGWLRLVGIAPGAREKSSFQEMFSLGRGYAVDGEGISYGWSGSHAEPNPARRIATPIGTVPHATGGASVPPEDVLSEKSTAGSPGPGGEIDPEKSDPEKSDPEKIDPEKSDPEKIDPEKIDPEKIDPEKIDPEKSEEPAAPVESARDAGKPADALGAIQISEEIQPAQEKTQPVQDEIQPVLPSGRTRAIEGEQARPGRDLEAGPDMPAGPEMPAWDPHLRQITRHSLARDADFASLRRGLDVPAALAQQPDLFDDIQVIWPGRLAGLRSKVTRLLLGQPAPYQPLVKGSLLDLGVWRDNLGRRWSNAGALWNNHITNPSPGSGWFNPRSLTFGQAAAVTSLATMKSEIPEMLRDKSTREIRLPGRLPWPVSEVEMIADVLAVRKGRTIRNVMTKNFHANADTSLDDTAVSQGFHFGNWVEPAFQIPGKPRDANNTVGPLGGHDYIRWQGHSAPTRSRYGQEFGMKKTRLSYTQLFLDVHYNVGANPRQRAWYNPQRLAPPTREYFVDDEVQVLEIWVPSEHLDIWLGLRPVRPPG